MNLCEDKHENYYKFMFALLKIKVRSGAGDASNDDHGETAYRRAGGGGEGVRATDRHVVMPELAPGIREFSWDGGQVMDARRVSDDARRR